MYVYHLQVFDKRQSRMFIISKFLMRDSQEIIFLCCVKYKFNSGTKLILQRTSYSP